MFLLTIPHDEVPGSSVMTSQYRSQQQRNVGNKTVIYSPVIQSSQSEILQQLLVTFCEVEISHLEIFNRKSCHGQNIR